MATTASYYQQPRYGAAAPPAVNGAGGPSATSSALPPPPNNSLDSSGNSNDYNMEEVSRERQLASSRAAVSRSAELLSCARTALKIAQSERREERRCFDEERRRNGGGGGEYVPRGSGGEKGGLPVWMEDVSPDELTLQRSDNHSNQYDDNDNGSSCSGVLSDASSLLSALDEQLETLDVLVRRRGHTNDPTEEIGAACSRFETFAREMGEAVGAAKAAGATPMPSHGIGDHHHHQKKSAGQRRRHYELVGAALESRAAERTDRFKKAMETRAAVLAERSRRRKMLANTDRNGGGAKMANKTAMNGAVAANGNTHAVRARSSAGGGRAAAKAARNVHASPLFTMTSGGGAASNQGTAAGYYGSSSAAYGGGYGGGGSTVPTNTGMRRRGNANTASSPPSNGSSSTTASTIEIDKGQGDDDHGNDDSAASARQAVQTRRQRRDARARVESARLAERSLAELTGMFSKMATLVSAQGEVLERIEDDVEAAGADIDAGHEEIVKLYGMTKGNRGLILKVFGILIFFIVFMKMY